MSRRVCPGWGDATHLRSRSNDHHGFDSRPRRRSPIDLILNLDEECLRVAVIDHSIFDPTPESSKELRETKWGLFLVDRIADNWGRISEGGIWAELRSPPKNP
jgi:hypothetical protein